MNFSEKDKKWIQENYPELSISKSEISGLIRVNATYNLETKKFLDLVKNPIDSVGGVRLSDVFSVSITERCMGEKAFSNLPKLLIKNVPSEPDRHINKSDNSACLCSTLEEEKYLKPYFKVDSFFSKLVIPFLYGQIFYSIVNTWPWKDYGHGAIGILESYDYLSDSTKSKECLQKLSINNLDSQWHLIRSYLKQKNEIKGHLMCFCGQKNKMRDCHYEAWQGLRKLRLDLKNQKINIK